ncbi:MAG: MoaD/ThiS family protein [Dethiobacter sp.]|jgi:sulfur carrier protein ThiS|nr:MoaD/ThiS family protein [Dethiobacter sp.]
MEKVQVEVQYKILWSKKKTESVEIVKGSTVADLLQYISFKENLEHLLMVYNGKIVFPHDTITENGQLVLISALIGG